MDENKKIKPKQYTHIDYEALLIYAMKNHISLEKAIEDNGLTIARSTVIRNIRKMKQDENQDQTVIDYYQNVYVRNYQKPILPESMIQTIEDFPDKKVVIKNELDDLYKKLSTMNQIAVECGGNLSEATRRINEGKTSLGMIKPISRQGLEKDIKYYNRIKEILEERQEKEEKGEEK